MIRFFTFEGRASRGRLLLWLAVALLAAWLCVVAFRTGNAAVMMPAGAMLGAAVAKLIAAMVRRRHDMGKGGGPALAMAAVGAVALFAGMPVALLAGAHLILLAGAVGLLVAGVPLLLPAARADAHVRVPSPKPGRAGLRLAIALAVLGGGTGYALAAWSGALAARHARDAAWADRARTGPDTGPDTLQQDYARETGR